MRSECIVNPQASSGSGEMIWKRLEPELIKRRVDYKACFTGYRGHAAKLAAEITADGGEHRIIVLGGDGTLNEAVDGIRFPEKVTLGYIPIGSSNDFARGMGLPKDPAEAMELVLTARDTRPIDVGVLTRAGRERRFLVSAGIGFDAAVCHEVCISKWKIALNRIGLGKLSYAAVAFDRLIKDKPVELSLVGDDGIRRIYPRTYFAAFMNTPYEGGGFKFCPQASPSDGLLDVIIVSDISRLKILCLLPLAFAGKHVGFKGIDLLRCKSVSVKTDRALAIHTDGEPSFLRREISVSLLPGKLRIIV